MSSDSGILKYTFEPILTCEMCGDKTEHHKLIGQRLNKSQGFSPRIKSGISVSVKRCTNCGLIYSDPMPVPASIQDHYGIPPESYWEKEYFNIEKDYFLTAINRAKEIIGFKPRMKALDVGSGIGKLVLALSNAGFDAHGLEPSATFHKKALEFTGLPESRIKLASIENANYAENEFDLIMVNAVAEHIYTPSASIANMLKWVKPEGVIYISVPSADYLITNLIDVYFKLTGTLYTSHISPMHEPFHLYEFTKKSFEENAKINNYKIVHTEYLICNIPFFPKILHPALRKYMEMTNTGMDYDCWIKKN